MKVIKTATTRSGTFGKFKSGSTGKAETPIHVNNAFMSSVILCITAFAIGSVMLYLSMPVKNLKEIIPASIGWMIGLIALFSAWLSRHNRASLGLKLLIIGFSAGMLAIARLTSGSGMFIGVSIIIVISAIAVKTHPQKQVGRIIIFSIIVGTAAYLIDMFGPAGRLTGSAMLQRYIPIIIGAGIFIYVVLIAREFKSLSIRAKLFTGFIAVALVPIALMAGLNIYLTQTALIRASNQALYSSASITANSIDAFLNSKGYAVSDEAGSPEFIAFLSLPADERHGSDEEKKADALLKSLQNKEYILNKNILGNTLIDANGNVVVDTSTSDLNNIPPFMGLDKLDPVSFKLMLAAGYPFISPLLFSSPGNRSNLYFAARVLDANDKPIGVLVSHYNGDVLQVLVENNQALAGQGSFAMLLDDNNLRLAYGASPETKYKLIDQLDPQKVSKLQTSGLLPDLSANELSTNLVSLANNLAKATTSQPNITAQAIPNDNQLYSGAVAYMVTRSWKVVYLQPQFVFLEPITSQARAILLLTVIIAVTVGVSALLIARQFTSPITHLTDVAQQVTAGNLLTQAPVESNDEIGTLATAFNTMTNELRQTLEDLEHRVAERTSELAHASEKMKYRASQLQTVAEVARAIASVQDPDQLMQMVTQLVSERFGFYHVGIFLLDKPGEYAVLQAANSEGGQRMLARGHRLKVGQVGIVGFVTGRGEPRVAMNVGEDAVYFNNPDLPYTRSEMAIPLKIGERIIGALDVQSMLPTAFTGEDISLISTLADQIAIAIENTRLYRETKNALGEMQSLHRQYLQEAWSKTVIERGKTGYEYLQGKILPVHGNESEEMDGSLTTPITVRGQIIGMFNLDKPENVAEWSDEDISLVKQIADQIGLALENARLIEETQRRAEREHLVAQITNKLRASNDPQVILQTALSELRQALQAKDVQVLLQSTPGSVEPILNRPSGNGHEPEEIPDH